MVDVAAASLRIIRYGVVVQMASHSYRGIPQHLAFGQSTPALLCPFGKPVQAQSELLSTGAPFKFEMSLSSLAAIVRKTQKVKLLGF